MQLEELQRAEGLDKQGKFAMAIEYYDKAMESVADAMKGKAVLVLVCSPRAYHNHTNTPKPQPMIGLDEIGKLEGLVSLNSSTP